MIRSSLAVLTVNLWVAMLGNLEAARGGTGESAPGGSTARELVGQARPLVIGHRGFCQEAPENTLPSFRMALAAGADLVELDFHQTKDGQLAVIHDGTLDRTTDAVRRWGGSKQAVSSKTMAELAELDAGAWFKPAFAGVRLSRLEEALAVIQQGSVTLIERKGGEAAVLLGCLRARQVVGRVVVQSFDWAFVKQCHELEPGLVLGALGPPATKDGRKLEEAEKVLSAAFIAEIGGLGAQLIVWNRQVTAGSVALAHARGCRVWVYTINDPALARELVQLGVDGIISDNPALIRQGLYPRGRRVSSPPVVRTIPAALAGHPGNIYLEGEMVKVALPAALPEGALDWVATNFEGKTVASGRVMAGSPRGELPLGHPGIGWYRIDFQQADGKPAGWTTAAVLARLKAAVPADSPICVDSATSWFAKDEGEQSTLASLAALAGVNGVRDRLRWGAVQPAAGRFATNTLYDRAAAAQNQAGLEVLQVFHDTPPWAREPGEPGGHFARDLRHVFGFAREMGRRYAGTVQAWEPWNEANVASFGGHTMDEMCSWQKAAWLGFKQSPGCRVVGWNALAAVPSGQQAQGVALNEAWPYFDTYNLHTYDWPHGYAGLWGPARLAAGGRPIWITESDRGAKHQNQPPWYDLAPRDERLKAWFMAESYALSLQAGASRHFHFILGHYHEPNGVQFGLLRQDFTPRPAYPALAAVGRLLAGARPLGLWRPAPDAFLAAFRAWPDGQEQDVLVAWAEREADWPERGQISVPCQLPAELQVQAVYDCLGRAQPGGLAGGLSRPVFILLPPGQALRLPLEPPLHPVFRPEVEASPVVLQLVLPRVRKIRLEDRPWSESYGYRVAEEESVKLSLYAYNFSSARVEGTVRAGDLPAGWTLTPGQWAASLEPMARRQFEAELRVAPGAELRDGWLTWRGDFASAGRPALGARFLVRAP